MIPGLVLPLLPQHPPQSLPFSPYTRHVYRRKDQLVREPHSSTHLVYVPANCGSPRLLVDTPHIAHATKVPGLIFLSGQTPVGSDGKVVEGGIQEHTV